jgi:hypothetical protein
VAGAVTPAVVVLAARAATRALAVEAARLARQEWPAPEVTRPEWAAEVARPGQHQVAAQAA